MSKVWIVFGKELLVMRRDRRLVASVFVVSLLVMPALMGLVGNIDRITGADRTPVEVLVPPGDALLQRLLGSRPDVRLLADTAPAPSGHSLRIEHRDRSYRILGDGTSRRESAKARELGAALEQERERQFGAALAARGIAAEDLQPFSVEVVDSASGALRSARALAALVPYLAILLLVSNAARALYVAVGEKEKNTLAALLVADLPRAAIVVGKIMAITVFTLASSAMLVVGMIGFAAIGFSIGAGGPAPLALSVPLVAGIGVNLMALALAVGALIMLIGTIARSQREASIYTAPVLFSSIALALMTMSSGEFSTAAYAVPILGNALAMKESFLGTLSAVHLLLPIAANLVAFTVLVLVSVRLYHREAVLFPG